MLGCCASETVTLSTSLTTVPPRSTSKDMQTATTYETPTAVCTSTRTGSIFATSSPSSSWVSSSSANCLVPARAALRTRRMRSPASFLSLEKCSRKALSTEMQLKPG